MHYLTWNVKIRIKRLNVCKLFISHIWRNSFWQCFEYMKETRERLEKLLSKFFKEKQTKNAVKSWDRIDLHLKDVVQYVSGFLVFLFLCCCSFDHVKYISVSSLVHKMLLMNISVLKRAATSSLDWKVREITLNVWYKKLPKDCFRVVVHSNEWIIIYMRVESRSFHRISLTFGNLSM